MAALKELTAYLYLEGEGFVPCGLIEHEIDGRRSSSAFRYGRRYLDRPGAIAIDPVQLPLRDGTHETPDGFPLFNGLRDAAPDRWGRYLLDRKFGRELSELEYLAAAGPDRVGALAFGPDAEGGPRLWTPSGFMEPTPARLDLETTAGAVQDALSQAETERLQALLAYGPSLGGARPKAIVRYRGRPCLAKFSVALDSRDEPAIEYASMTLARNCGLDVPPVHRTTALGRSVYLIERFDRRPRGTPESPDEPLPYVSALTLLGAHESDYTAWSYLALADAMVRFSADAPADLRELFGRMVYNILVFNNDDHPRNLGFLHAGRGCWRLSPFFDAVPASVHGETRMQAMVVGSEGRVSSVENALSRADRFHLSATDARAIVDRIREKVAGWREHFLASGVPERDCSGILTPAAR